MTRTPGGSTGRSGSGPDLRQFAQLEPPAGGFVLEAGGVLGAVTVAYETWGSPNADRTNGVLVLHALTGDSHAAGSSGPEPSEPGWWEGLIGPGAPIDTGRYFVVCPNVLGGCRGSTGPGSPSPDGSPYGSRFPLVTIRDQVAIEAALADHLGVDRWAGVIGGSMGGMRVLEWIIGHPERVARAVVLAVGAAATAEQIALCALQIRAIRSDPAFAGGDYYDQAPGPAEGLILARGIGQVSYRTELELDDRFGREAQPPEDPLKGGRFAVESYLQHQGEKLARRFDANSYIALSEAMNQHDVGRGRGGRARALGAVQAEVTVAGIASDRLYPLRLQEELAALLPGGRPVSVIESRSGHDGFLLELDQVGAVVTAALGG